LKNIQKNLFIVVFTILFPMVAFSQDTVPLADFSEGTSGLDNTTPIDHNLFIVLIIGVVYVFFKFKKYTKKVKSTL
jgi:hypothetical protein